MTTSKDEFRRPFEESARTAKLEQLVRDLMAHITQSGCEGCVVKSMCNSGDLDRCVEVAQFEARANSLLGFDTPSQESAEMSQNPKFDAVKSFLDAYECETAAFAEYAFCSVPFKTSIPEFEQCKNEMREKYAKLILEVL